MDPRGKWGSPLLCGRLSLSGILPHQHKVPSPSIQAGSPPQLLPRDPQSRSDASSRAEFLTPPSVSLTPGPATPTQDRNPLAQVRCLPGSDPHPDRARSPHAHSPCPGGHPGSVQAAPRTARRRGPAAMAAMVVRAAALRRPGGRFRWRTPVVAEGLRSAARDAAGRAGPGLGGGGGCPRARQSLGWDRSPLPSSHPQSPFLRDPAGSTAG